MARLLKIAWRHTEEELYEPHRREKDADLASVMAGIVAAAARGAAESGEGGGGGDTHDDSTVGSVV